MSSLAAALASVRHISLHVPRTECACIVSAESNLPWILGEATIRAIVEKGGKVIIFDINEERGEAIAKELAGSAFWPGATDVASEDSVVASIEKGVEKFGNISGVVNCGGIGMAQKVTFPTMLTLKHNGLMEVDQWMLTVS